jgi:hypothetical protein
VTLDQALLRTFVLKRGTEVPVDEGDLVVGCQHDGVAVSTERLRTKLVDLVGLGFVERVDRPKRPAAWRLTLAGLRAACAEVEQ